MVMDPDRVDDVSHRRLLFAKRMYEHGLEHNRSDDPFSKALAIHHFHCAVETVLKAILMHYDIRSEGQFNVGFEVLMNEIDNHFGTDGPRLPLRQQIANLNTVRNLVQHHAYEGVQRAEELEGTALRFLEVAAREYFGLEFGDLSVVSQIANAEVREFLEDAQAYMKAGDYVRSAAASVIALKTATNLVRKPYQRDSFFSPFFVGARLGESGNLAKAVERTVQHVNALQEIIEMVCLGVDYADYIHLCECAPDCYQTLGATDNWQVAHRTDPTYSLADARSAEQFVVAVILDWERRGLLSPAEKAGVPSRSRTWDKFTYASPGEEQEEGEQDTEE
jgi:hypothetical protein